MKIKRRVFNLSVFNIAYIVIFFSLYITGSYNILKSAIILYYAFEVALLVLKVKKDDADIIDLIAMFFLMYNIWGTIVFSSDMMLRRMEIFVGIRLNASQDSIMKYLLVMVLCAIPYSYLLLNKSKNVLTSIHTSEYGKVQKEIADWLGFVCEGLLIILIGYLLYMYKVTGGKYIWFTQLGNKNRIFNLMGWISIFASGAVPAGFFSTPYKKRKHFYVLIIGIIFLFLKLKIRMYCALFLIAMLTNMCIRGMRIRKKHIFFLGGMFVLLLLTNIFRFENFNFSNLIDDSFSVLGEFILPNISAYYLINNPLKFDGGVRCRDLILQLLPSSIRPTSALYSFNNYYLSREIKVWPVGGISFQGQVFFYFQYFFLAVMCIIVIYLAKVRKDMKKDKTEGSLALAAFPVFCMILPRMEVWTLRSMLFSAFIYFVTIKIKKSEHRYNSICR